MYLDDLSAALWDLFDVNNEVSCIERSVDLARQALAATPPTSPIWSALHSNLGNRLREHYLRAGNRQSLDAVIEAYEVPVRDPRFTPAELAVFKSNLALGLLDRFVEDGAGADLERATTLAAEAGAEKHDEPTIHDRLGACYFKKYGLTGDLVALDKAIDSFSRAVAGTPDASPGLPLLASSLGAARRTRFEVTGRTADLDAAIEAFATALQKSPPGATSYSRYAQGSAAVLLTRYQRSKNLGDLETGIEHARLGVQAYREDGIERPLLLDTLSTAFLLRWRARREVDDLKRAISLAEESATAAQRRSPHTLGVARALAEAHRARFQVDGDPETERLASAHYRRACQEASSAPAMALEAALNWASWAERRGAWAELVEAGSTGLEIARLLFERQALRAHKEAWLRNIWRIPSQTAWAHVRLNRLEQAVLVLENGRTMLLAEAMEQRERRLGYLKGQGHGARALVERLFRARRRLQALEFAETQTSRPQRTDLRQPLDAAIEELRAADEAVRRAEGLDRQESGLEMEDIKEAAGDAPIIYLLPGEPDGAGLVVRRGHPVESITLPGLREARVRDFVARSFEALRTDDDDLQQAVIDEAARWLWKAAAFPLITWARVHCPSPPPDEARAISVVAVGPLNLLPLHAASVDGPPGAHRRYALDELCISYLPNARAARRSRWQAASEEQGRFLGVIDPTGDLPGAHLDVDPESLGLERDARLLSGSQATVARVLDELRSCGVVHFACHGFAELASPLDSGLVMAGKQVLHLKDILQAEAIPRVVVLSACETAIVDPSLPDEVIGLPAAFVSAGARAVVGTLWRVPDESTGLLMSTFYSGWRRARLRPAEALRRAQQRVRDLGVTPGQGERPFEQVRFWGAFVFTGRLG